MIFWPICTYMNIVKYIIIYEFERYRVVLRTVRNNMSKYIIYIVYIYILKNKFYYFRLGQYKLIGMLTVKIFRDSRNMVARVFRIDNRHKNTFHSLIFLAPSAYRSRHFTSAINVYIDSMSTYIFYY